MQNSTLAVPVFHRARSVDRIENAISCLVVRSEQPDCEGLIRNLSPAGALLQSSELFPALSFVSLRFGDMKPVPAQVSWSESEQCGCTFVPSLTVRQYLRLLQGGASKALPPGETSIFSRLLGLLTRKAT